MPDRFFLVGMDTAFRDKLSVDLESQGLEGVGVSDDISGINGTRLGPDVLVIIDQSNPECQQEALRASKALSPSSPVALLASSLDLASMHTCFELGAAGYVLKNANASQTISALCEGTPGRNDSSSNATNQRPAA